MSYAIIIIFYLIFYYYYYYYKTTYTIEIGPTIHIIYENGSIL